MDQGSVVGSDSVRADLRLKAIHLNRVQGHICVFCSGHLKLHGL